ncbi:MAG: hypothetical protein GWO00_19915, partial [Gemmatimonadetes bacterium]|nr:hypothetical protein [Gemmatimonadota bacterium]NIT89294.1 hypothetical protein [Gemmatimonadota bacterium]NIU33105.1 hypothetical protein [Gemmatimonadota bacterium]NIV63458.1 hypothetical protein [Gemmatimonadota bacterium]NIW66176.1 hypothetical protein [Gemmatimonadota bacterium]
TVASSWATGCTRSRPSTRACPSGSIATWSGSCAASRSCASTTTSRGSRTCISSSWPATAWTGRSAPWSTCRSRAAPRTHYFPETPVEPTVYAFAREWSRPPDEAWNRGFTAATVPDRRWSRVDIKTICLLPNALAFQAARDRGADDAILVRDGVAIEGAHQNFWAVFGGTAVTHPTTGYILPGITRGVVMEEARAAGIPVEERPIQIEELEWADECFFTGTTGEVRPVVEIDGRPVGDGRVGDVTRRLSDAFLARVEATKEAGRVEAS